MKQTTIKQALSHKDLVKVCGGKIDNTCTTKAGKGGGCSRE